MTRRPDLRELYTQQIAQRGFQTDASQLAAVEQLNELRRQLIESGSNHFPAKRLIARLRGRSESPLRGLYLWGGVGRGKTWLMDLFFNSLPFAERRRRHFHRFMHEVHAELKSLSQLEAPLEHVAERISRDSRVLCFDELYVADIADAMILGALFTALLERGVTLVITSNLPPRDLYKNGLQRQRFTPAIELLERHTTVVAMEGTVDYRLRQLTQAGTYLSALAPDTPQRLNALFDDLSDGEEDASKTIEIEGRPIAVLRASDNAVWFDFAALCEGPRSPADYIEIARDYQSVLLSAVPIFDETRDNAARRFISLVDEFYDRNVNLIVSATASPSELYRGERLQQDFHRTTSRLTEMQSKEYLAREHRP
jgi:cell division protein ZapE